jgi:phosphotransacetylase
MAMSLQAIHRPPARMLPLVMGCSTLTEMRMRPKQEEADKLGVDISQCTIEDPKTSQRVDKYVDLLCEARKHKVCHTAQQHPLHL